MMHFALIEGMYRVLPTAVFFNADDSAVHSAARRRPPLSMIQRKADALEREQLVLVADLGGGRSDFSLVRVGPNRKSLRNRKEDVFERYGVHSLDAIETELRVGFTTQELIQASRKETARIEAAAETTARLAGVRPADISAVYFTGGSPGLQLLTNAIAANFPKASALFGDQLESVASGLGIYARRLFEATV
jgi:molecular chaperone DnaK (HSP70)